MSDRQTVANPKGNGQDYFLLHVSHELMSVWI